MRGDRQIEQIDVTSIDILPGRRAPVGEAVTRLASSMERLGLKTPVSVRYVADRPSATGTDDSYILVSGAHRLEAAKQLGWQKIECFVSDCDDIDAQLWEISENLHRAELSALERDEQVAKWIALADRRVQSGQSVQNESKRGDRRGHRQEGGVSAAARELGVERKDAERAVKVASIAPEAKQAARDAGLDDNRSAMLAAAKEATPEAQVAKISEIAQSKINKPKPVKLADAPLNDFETVEKQVAGLMSAWNRAGVEARERFLATIDKPVMDRRFA